MQLLESLWREERRLIREWEVAALRENRPRMASIRQEYHATFDRLKALCREMKIIR